MSDITKRFDGPPVLQNVDFGLFPGEVHILAGENGAGKSTLIKILGGVHTDYSGDIRLKNESVRFSSPIDAARRGITVIHQELSLVPSMSVSDNIFLGREESRFPGWLRFSSQKQGAENALSQLDMNIDVNRPVEEYPISVQQMIEIAKALSREADIIVMDEPTSALTRPEVKSLFQTIHTLKQRGCAIIYITHKMEEIYQIGDRITVLRDGRRIGSDPASDLPESKLVSWMVGREISDQIPERKTEKGDVLLSVKNLTAPDSAGKRPLVDNVSFDLHRGEILGIAGLQGSGSSELLNALFGRYGARPRGSVFLEDRTFRILSPGHSIANGIALLTNDRKTSGLIPGMSITKNITLASIPDYSPGFWMRESREKQCAVKHKKELNIRAERLDADVSSLSGGNQQKVILARWNETDPQILLLDEPTRGIDVGAKHEIYELMNQWTAAGRGIILITSEMPELIALSDRIMVMHRGRVTAWFNRGDVTQEDILSAAMGLSGDNHAG